MNLQEPVWIDLGGIAKGYAVDRATECLRSQGVSCAVINAGGDVRVLGSQFEQIALGIESPIGALPIVELADGSIASSSGHRQRLIAQRSHGPHVDGRRRSAAPTDRFVCVLAEHCIVADALTKVVLANGSGSVAPLRQFGASAFLFDAGIGWQSVNLGAEPA